MGLILVFTGIGLLLAQFNQLAVINFSLKWWPIIFILLGIEVLVLNYLNTTEKSKIKYDIFGVIITLLIVGIGLGLQSMREVGLVAKAQTMISSQIFTVQDSKEILLEAGIKKIILKTYGNQVSLRNSSDNIILTQSELQVRAQSRIDAQGIAGQYSKISQQRSGDTLYLMLPKNQDSNLITGSSYSLALPENVDIDVEGAGSSLDVYLDAVKNDWQIYGLRSCSIKIPAGSDLTINALLNREEVLHGNLTWTKSNTASANSTDNSNSLNNQQVNALAKLGNASHKMNILEVDDLTVNALP
jgi:hypothetical protein